MINEALRPVGVSAALGRRLDFKRRVEGLTFALRFPFCFRVLTSVVSSDQSSSFSQESDFIVAGGDSSQLVGLVRKGLTGILTFSSPL